MGQPIVLSEQEQRIANHAQQMCNALGFQVDITTLTQILSRVIEQKFFTIAPADYVPVRVGEGAWGGELLTYRDFQIGGDFETGIINSASENSRLAEVTSAVDAIRVPITNWAKAVTWTLFELRQAQVAGNWDIVTSKERARKKNWDLGIQRIAFLGAASNTNVKGLLTQTDVTANTSIITESITGMTTAEFNAFVGAIVQAYRANSFYTAYPDRFIIPESDYNGLATAVSPDYPMISKLQYLLDAFRRITMNPNFQILPLAYANQAQNADVTGLNKNRYTLLNYDEDSIRMDIPVDYTNTLQNSVNNFQFNSVGYGQFTGVQAYRAAEMMYFDWAA